MMFLLVSIISSFEMKTALGRTIHTRRIEERKTKEKEGLSNEKKWYFIRFEEQPDFEKLNEIGVKISSDSFISTKWYRIFCPLHKLSEVRKLNEIEYGELKAEDKLINIKPSNEVTRFLIEADESFSEVMGNLPMNITKLSESIYQCVVNNGIEGANLLANINSVASIIKYIPTETHNRYSAGRIQGTPLPSVHDGVYDTVRYLEKHGINGDGQIVMITDSGIDVTSGYFYSEGQDVPFDRIDTSHRKIVAYNSSLADKLDLVGHGTHVAGTVAGKANCVDCVDALYNGVAPEAKIAFFDSSIKADDLKDISNKDYIEFLENTGAKIATNSWGAPLNFGSESFETVRNFRYTQLSLSKPDVLVMFSAGNDGHLNRSIGTPGSTKNFLTVGNIDNPYSLGYESMGFNIYGEAEVHSGENKYRGYLPLFSGHLMNNTIPKMEGVLVDGVEANESEIAYFKSLKCSNFEKKYKAAVVLETFDNFEIMMKACNKSDYPIIVVPDVDRISLGNVSIYPQPRSDYKFMIDKSSSVGPTTIGIKKPDVSAIGATIISAKSIPDGNPGHYDRTPMKGTSMATPIVAGAAALTRQYFLKMGVDPDGCMMRALLAASCDPVPNQYIMREMTEGHGEVNLSNILNVENKPAKHIGYKQAIRMQSGDHLVSKFKVVKGNEKLRIGFAYNDVAASTETLIPIIVDASLYVVSPNASYFGNNEEEMFSTLETVVIDNAPAGDYEIHIVVSGLEKTPVNGSVVVIGGIERDQELQVNSERNKCLDNCGGHGTCNVGVCECEDGYSGLTCQKTIETISKETFNETYSPLETKLYQIKPSIPTIYTFNIDVLAKKQYSNTFLVYIGDKKPKTVSDFETSRLACSKEVGQLGFIFSAKKGKTVYIMIYNANPYTLDIDFSYTGVSTNLVIGLSVGGVILLLLIIVATIIFGVLYCKKRKTQKEQQTQSEIGTPLDINP